MPRDIPSMMRLERSLNTAAHWSEQQYQSIFGSDAPAVSWLAWIAKSQENSEILGFLVAHHVSPEWELENIVVAPELQGKGIGTQLMQEFLNQAQQNNNGTVFLEVRESNVAARALYKKVGFQQIGRRKSYYNNPLEDAILYSKKP